jgi:hypothetical protein
MPTGREDEIFRSTDRASFFKNSAPTEMRRTQKNVHKVFWFVEKAEFRRIKRTIHLLRNDFYMMAGLLFDSRIAALLV